MEEAKKVMKLLRIENIQDFALLVVGGTILSCLVCIISPTTLMAQKSRPAATAAKSSKQMSFSLHHEDSGSSSQFFLLAEGVITAETPRRFESFMRTVRDGNPVVYFNSPGGNLLAGIELGLMIRRRGLDTYVGGEYVSFVFKNNKEVYRTIVEESACFSACAYAFLGGTSRRIASDKAFGVHQFYSKQDGGESRAQISLTVLANYLDEMGVDRKVLDIASLTAPNRIQLVSIAASRQLNIDNTNPPKGEWSIRTDDSGKLYAILTQKQPSKNGVITLILEFYRGVYLMTMTHHIRQKFRSRKELVDIFQGDHNQPRFCAESEGEAYCGMRFEFVGFTNWRQSNDGGFTRVFRMSYATMLQISRAKNIDFYSGFANAYSDVDPSFTFSTKNLRGVLIALSNQR